MEKGVKDKKISPTLGHGLGEEEMEKEQSEKLKENRGSPVSKRGGGKILQR